MISVLVCSRIEGNENSSLLALLASLTERTRKPDELEVLIKFDDDDPRVSEVVGKLNEFPFAVKHCFGPRLRGYIDIHHGYCQAYQMVNPASTIVGAMADDFIAVLEGWDQFVVNAAAAHSDGIFLLHGRPHPWCDYQGWNEGRPFPKSDMYFIRNQHNKAPRDLHLYRQNKFNMNWLLQDMVDLYIIDEAPFWGRKLIDICGNFGPVSFTDAWTLALEHFLWHKHNVNRTVFTPKEFIYRKLNNAIDQPGAPRWETDRLYNFNFIKSEAFTSVVEKQSDDVAEMLKKASLVS